MSKFSHHHCLKTYRNLGFLLVFIFANMWQIGCISTTLISSRPAAATVTLDKSTYVGKTPILIKEQAWVWTKHELLLRHKGYEPHRIELRPHMRSLNITLCSVCFLGTWMMWPIAFLGKYPEHIVVQMKKIKSVRAHISNLTFEEDHMNAFKLEH